MKLASSVVPSSLFHGLIEMGILGPVALLFVYSQPIVVDGQVEGRMAQPTHTQISSEVTLVGAAEARSLKHKVFLPGSQPEIYWHDADWSIDLIIPPNSPNLQNPFSLNIRSSTGRSQIVKLDEDYAQIDSIARAPNNKAIVIADINGTTTAFSIIDLELATDFDGGYVYGPSISPDGRFILYNNWYPPHGGASENQYFLYDTLKTPKENTCGQWDSNPRHKGRDDERIQVFPHPIVCTDGEDDTDDNMATNFAWAADSSKIVFADVKSGVMSRVLVTMPVGRTDLPKTSVYTLQGAQDVCAGATDAVGEKYCDYHVIESLGWEGDSVKAVFHHQFGMPLNLQLTIPVSSFVPIGK